MNFNFSERKMREERAALVVEKSIYEERAKNARLRIQEIDDLLKEEVCGEEKK